MGFILAAAWALCVVVFLPGSYETWEPRKAAVLRIAGAGLLVAVLATPGWSRRLGQRRLDLAVVLWLIVEALATLASRSPRLSLFGDAMQHEGLLTSIALGGIYLASRCCLTSEKAANRALNAWLAAAGVAALYAFAQAAGLDPLPWLRSATIGGVIRPFGTLGHANVLGATTAAAATLALALARRGRGAPPAPPPA